MLPTEIQSLRAAYGLTQGQLGRALGVSSQAVWAWEHGQYPPAAYHELVLLRLAEMQRRARDRKRAAEALLAAQYRQPAPAAGGSAKAALAAGLAAFGIGLLLGALFSQPEREQKGGPRATRGRRGRKR